MITSKSNESVKYLTKLKQKKYRIKEQKYIISKPNIINEAIKNNVEFETISCINSNANYYVSKEIMHKITDDDFDEAIICRTIDVKVMQNENTLVLDSVTDPGNMGTMLRSALAFGIKNIVISPNSVDLYNPKVISAMQGCHFYQRIEYCELGDYFSSSDNKNIMTFLDEPNNKPSSTAGTFNIVVGSEGNGIDKKYKEYMDYNYLIDIDFESLNVAVAASIIMHDLTRS